MTNLNGQDLVSAFVAEAEKLAEAEAKALGKEKLPGFIAMLETAEAKIGSPTIFQVKKELEEAGEIMLVDLAKAALAWCNS